MRLRLSLMGILFVCGLSVQSMDGYYFFDLMIKQNQNQITIKWQPQRLISYEQYQDPNYSFSGFIDVSFDSYLQNGIYLADTLDKMRDQIKIKSKEPYQITAFNYVLTVREASGKALERQAFNASFFLTPQPGKLLVKQGELESSLDIAELKTHDGYLKFLKIMGRPMDDLHFKMPKPDEFVVDLYYMPSFLVKNLLKTQKLSDEGVKAYRALFTATNYSQSEHLGTTHCRKSSGRLPQVRSGHLHFMKDATSLFATILEKKANKVRHTEELEHYLEMIPTDLKAHMLLLKSYLKEKRTREALAFINKNRALYPLDSEVLKIHQDLVKREEAIRDRLLAQKQTFKKDEGVKLDILSPRSNDYVGGQAKMAFEMKGHHSPILRMDVEWEGQVLGSIYEPPFEIPFRMSPEASGRAYLKLVVYFRNKTYQAASLTVKPLFIADESEVNLATLRVSATQGIDNYLMNLRPIDFVISENSDDREIQNFRRDKAPLRVAILIDTSFSMSGEKLYRAQEAVNAFLGKLNSDDRACIYTFDQNVMKLSDYTNDFKQMQSVLLTLSPHHSTSLHDALVQSNQDLMGMDGNRVVIVVSDGRDSASELSAENVNNVFLKSPVMVYSVVLSLDNVSNKAGQEFLGNLSRRTGSASLAVDKVASLERVFTSIYEELRSFYLMDFYSTQSDFALTSVDVKVRQSGVRTRFSRQKTEAVWQ